MTTRIDNNRPREISQEPRETRTPAPLAKPTAAPAAAPSGGEAALVKAYVGTKRALEQDPSQADRRIGERLRGCSSTDREIVKLTLAQRGNVGLKKYADAEQVLRSLRPFSKEERGDILASMKVGTRFGDAVRDATASRQVPVRYESKPAGSAVRELETAALANSRTHAAKVAELARHVTALNREIGKVDRKAELVAGLGSAAGVVGSAAVASVEGRARGSSKALDAVAHRADAAGGFMVGALTDKIRDADHTTGRFLRASGTYTDARNRHDRAVRGHDFEGMARAQKDMQATSKELARLATQLAEQARSIVSMQRDLDTAVVETAITLVLSCVSIGKGGSHQIKSVGHAAVDVFTDAAKERPIGAAVEHLRSR